MKHLFMLALMMVAIFLTGCTHNWFSINYDDDLSDKEGYKEWVGREIKTTKELLISHISNFDAKFIVWPDWQSYPTIEEYKKYGKTKTDLLSVLEILGVVPIGTEFTIKSVGLFQFNTMIGKEGLMLIKNKKDGSEYYLKAYDLFSFRDGTISLNHKYFELIPSSNVEVKEQITAVEEKRLPLDTEN